MPALRQVATMGLYQLVFVLVFVVYSPLLIWRMILNPGYRRGILERTGRVPRVDSERPIVWIHGVSVGEVKVAGGLIEALKAQYPNLELVLSSTTPTGHSLARKLHPDLRVIYYPLDFGAFPRRALDRVKPVCVLLVELEIWPNFLHAAARRRIPVAVVNGRISGRSFRGYRLFRGLLPQFNLIQRFCVQDEAYQERLRRLDVDPARIELTGNMKYDSVTLKAPTSASEELRSWLSPDGREVVVAGSTHADEEANLAALIGRLRSGMETGPRLVLAPRHPERSGGVRDAVTKLGAGCVCWSQVSAPLPPLKDQDVVLVDTIGQLENFYGAADVAFVGGSMVPRGGQNMLEPAALGKAVVIGPHVDNFLTDVELLCRADAAVMVQSWDELESRLGELLADDDLRRELGERAVAVIRDNKGATTRTLAILAPMLGRLGSERSIVRG